MESFCSGQVHKLGKRLPRLLLIDDEPVLLRCYGRLLAQEYEVDAVSSAAEALRLLVQGEAYSIVLSDLQMPVQDGLGLLRSVRALAPSTIRLLFTGGADRRISAALGDGTVVTVIEKPCPVEQLFGILRDCLEIHSLQNAV